MKIKTWGLLLVVFTGLLFAQTANQNKTMKVVASGKDAVLECLANDARQQTHGKTVLMPSTLTAQAIPY